jgi:N-[(2S)-2-amino-2-carboxyethyl]-L-glutamate dehydrogenase
MSHIDVLLLSQTAIQSLELTNDDVLTAVERAMVEHSASSYEMHPKIGVHPTGTDPGNFIHAMPAYLKQMGVCGLKWVGGFPKNHERGLPNVTGLQVCNDIETGVPTAIMDCAYLTGLRTAAVSTAIARRCARTDATTLAICGCGFQGGLHLEFLVKAIPSIQQVRCFDVRSEAAAALADRARGAGFLRGDIVVCDSPEGCIRDADVISTCTNGDDQIIHKDWFKPGAFGVGIEGGCAYTEGALHQADKFIVDDIPLAEYFQKLSIGLKNDKGEDCPEFPGGIPPVYSTIGDIIAGQKTARDSDSERIIAIPIGMAICDVSLGDLVYRRAKERGVGETFRLA